MGSVCCCFGNDEYRTLKRSESIRSSRSSHIRITKQEQLLNTKPDIAESCISITEMETTNKLTESTTVSKIAIESEDVQMENTVTTDKCPVEECLTRYKTEMCNRIEKNEKLTESIEKSIQAENTEETIEKFEQLRASFKLEKETMFTMIDEVMKNVKNASGLQGTVQLFNTQVGETMEKLKEELKQYLNAKLGNVHFINCNKTCDILQDHLLIIPCLTATRVGADATHAIENIPNPGNTALVLIHNKELHALPKIKSSLTLNEQKFKNLREIFDLAFVKDRGFYRCDMNTENLDALCTFCKLTPVGERL